jgi:hypothetical protein
MSTPVLLTLTQMADSHRALSYNTLRWDIQKRRKDLVARGILLKCGRKWIINEQRYLEDLAEQAKSVA